MRNLIRQIVAGYKSLKLEGQDEGYVVFSGQDPDTQQAVSIKILPRLLGKDPQISRQFSGLAQTIRQLNHPNIASVRKVGEEAGLPYLVTRAIEKAQPLAAQLNQPWAVDTAADVVMQVGQALDHAYQKGVVHGSLTPDNVVVEEDGQVTVTDFGLDELMALVGGSAKQAASPYLAPERVAGQTANAPADVYSLGALAYGMLAKQPPEVVAGKVLPPSRFNPDVTPEMDKVIVRALDPDPEKRYPNVKTFLTAMGALTLVPAQGKPAEAVPTGTCPKCGAKNQSARFCRQCGARVDQSQPAAPVPPARSVLDEPIQVTKVDVGRIKVGKGIEMRDTVIAQPMTVSTGEISSQFPEALEMPNMTADDLWPVLGARQMIVMPEPPEMPSIDWAEVAPPMPEVPTIEDVPYEPEDD